VHRQVLLGHSFFPSLIETPFANGLHLAFIAAAGLCFLGAVFSWLRGPGVQLEMVAPRDEIAEGFVGVGEIAMMEAGVGADGDFVEVATRSES
jgi:hypothetical protein